ncbi:hypothetical protein ACH5RR_033557 [Cinchona calisaya]|uniref:Uncharacterized protein n=1 Tax=Cinchona calisaya TaxID=153742 RepID=A0ABD2YLA6_9GENT
MVVEWSYGNLLIPPFFSFWSPFKDLCLTVNHSSMSLDANMHCIAKLIIGLNCQWLIMRRFLSCRTMLYNLRRPPNGFRSFVVEHFREHGDFILAAISAYRNGDAIVGQYQEGGSVSSSSYLPRNFKANLERIHSDLRLAFMGIDTSPTKMKNLALTSVFMGIDTSPTKMKNLALTSVRKEKGETAAAVKKSQSSVKQPKQGISGKIFNVLKKIFQCKTGKDVKAIA